MTDEAKHDELYRIINRSVAKCGNHEDMPVNTEIAAYKERCFYKQKASKEDICPNLPDSKELKLADNFCNILEEYRISVDAYTKTEPLSEAKCRRLYEGIQYYRPHIYQENQTMLTMLENNMKRRLPEFRDRQILKEYNERAVYIYRLRKSTENLRRKNKQAAKNYEIPALHFFEDVLNDAGLKQIQGCFEKLELYQNCLKVVDCLPAEKYGRLAKFKLKCDLNFGLKKIAISLGEDKIADLAAEEENRYNNAMLRVLLFAGRKAIKKIPLSKAERNRRAEEEWLYK